MDPRRANRFDWIGLYRRDADPARASYFAYRYTGAAVEGSVSSTPVGTADGPAPGTLHHRLLSAHRLSRDRVGGLRRDDLISSRPVASGSWMVRSAWREASWSSSTCRQARMGAARASALDRPRGLSCRWTIGCPSRSGRRSSTSPDRGARGRRIARGLRRRSAGRRRGRAGDGHFWHRRGARLVELSRDAVTAAVLASRDGLAAVGHDVSAPSSAASRRATSAACSCCSGASSATCASWCTTGSSRSA